MNVEPLKIYNLDSVGVNLVLQITKKWCYNLNLQKKIRNRINFLKFAIEIFLEIVAFVEKILSWTLETLKIEQ